MTHTKLFAGLLLAAVMALPATAQDWGYRHEQYRDLRRDYARVERLRADIARDRARLDEDIRCGRSRAASRDAADLARDQRALEAQLRDIHHDRRELREGYYSSGYWRGQR